MVSLDLTITDELRKEGFARDIVRSIQDARRQLDCAISDNISLDIIGDVPTEWLEYICSETLGQTAQISEPDMSLEVSYEDGSKVTVNIKK